MSKNVRNTYNMQKYKNLQNTRYNIHRMCQTIKNMNLHKRSIILYNTVILLIELIIIVQ